MGLVYGVLGSNATKMNAVFKVLLKGNLNAFCLKFGMQDLKKLH